MSKLDFEKNLSKYKEKSINKLAKKCTKSCLVTRSKDMESLCHLAYWLYIYDYKDEILNIYNLIDIDIPKKVNFNIWTWILSIWGLQAFIYEKNGELSKKTLIIEKIHKLYSVPRREGQSPEEAFELHQRIANRQTYEEICNYNQIERCIKENDKRFELSYRFSALLSMISYKVTGDYPALESNREKLVKDIREYIEILKLNG